MGTTIAAVVGLLLALYAAADLILRICYCVLFGRTARGCLALHVREHEAEYQIRRLALWRYLVPHGGFDWAVVVPDDGAHQTLCRELGLTVYTEKEWAGMHKSPLQSETDGV